ncbi:hypothetical protein HDU97_004314 [Phlyctochytrium planicorne]|nr:hypothetical protein HDU97_004314 [Phlyctochytrium planicorne]
MIAAFILALAATATASHVQKDFVFRETAFSRADCYRFFNTIKNNPACIDGCKERNEKICTGCLKSVRMHVNYQYAITISGEKQNDKKPTFNLGWNEIAFTEADCRRFQQTLERKCNGNEACKNYNWNKYYECSKRVNEEKKNYYWVSRMVLEADEDGESQHEPFDHYSAFDYRGSLSNEIYLKDKLKPIPVRNDPSLDYRNGLDDETYQKDKHKPIPVRHDPTLDYRTGTPKKQNPIRQDPALDNRTGTYRAVYEQYKIRDGNLGSTGENWDEGSRDDSRSRDGSVRTDRDRESSHEHDRTFDVRWNGEARDVWDCRRIRDDVIERCYSNESCRDYVWNIFFECEKRVHGGRRVYSWVSEVFDSQSR